MYGVVEKEWLFEDEENSDGLGCIIKFGELRPICYKNKNRDINMEHSRQH